MLLLQDKLTKLNLGWNERPLTEADAYRICRKFKVSIDELPLAVGGFFYRVKGRDCIAIDSRLTGLDKLFVLFHEIGHFLLHVPDSGATANFHGVGLKTRKEDEADAFALCAILPKRLIHTSSPQELIDDGFDAEMVRERFTLYERKGL